MRKILIVDDEEDLCVLMQSYLKALGHGVYVASTLDFGIKEIERLKPDVIFLDNNLPDGIGWSSLDYIREQSPESKINLMSAYQSMPRELDKLMEVQYLEKPISLSALKDYI
jgi:DNA-binding response OmpR family regulator